MNVFTDPRPETYRLNVRFTLPDDAGGRTAIAVSTGAAARIAVLYSFLITGIFIIIWSSLTILALHVFPIDEKYESHRQLKEACEASDPLHALIMISQHSFNILRGKCKKSKANDGHSYLFLYITLLVIASGTLAGSVALGAMFPNMLIIGASAPVNPNLMYYPDLKRQMKGSIVPDAEKLHYAGKAAVRAFGEGTQVSIRNRVKVDKGVDQSWGDQDGQQLERYKINYQYHVNGTEMGLQKFGKLALDVQGSCSFADDWWESQVKTSDRRFDNYTLWRGNESGNMEHNLWAEINFLSPPLAYFIGTDGRNMTEMYYAIVPQLADKYSTSQSLDPWYQTEQADEEGQKSGFPAQVKSRRPPLKCHQVDRWSYGRWKGSTRDLFPIDRTAPVKFPPAIWLILESEFSIPMIFNLGRALQAGILESSTRMLPGGSMGIDAAASSAMRDMERIIIAAYLSTRNIFSDAAMAGLDVGISNRENILKGPDGEMKSGAGDVVIVSSVVSSLQFGCLVAIPSILGFLIIARIIFEWRMSRGYQSVTGESG